MASHVLSTFTEKFLSPRCRVSVSMNLVMKYFFINVSTWFKIIESKVQLVYFTKQSKNRSECAKQFLCIVAALDMISLQAAPRIEGYGTMDQKILVNIQSIITDTQTALILISMTFSEFSVHFI